MTTELKESRAVRRMLLRVAEGLTGITIAIAAIFGIHLLIGRDFKEFLAPTTENVFAIEVLVFCLIVVPFVVFEVAQLGRVIWQRTEPEAPRLQTMFGILAAFLGSLTIYVSFVWITALVNPNP